MHFKYVQRRSKGCVVLIMFSKEAVLWYNCHYNGQYSATRQLRLFFSSFVYKQRSHTLG